MSSDWWARKLQQQAPQAPQQPQHSYPPVGYRPPPVAPQAPVQRPMAPPQQRPQGEMPGYQEPLREGERQQVLDPNRDPNEQMDIVTALHYWKGGEAHRRERSLACPSCGSRNYFSRKGAWQRAGSAPASHCFECGYNGIYEQGLPPT